jgi:hypothetical protein
MLMMPGYKKLQHSLARFSAGTPNIGGFFLVFVML